MSEPIQIGIAGASGMMGLNRLQHFSRDPRCRVVAVAGRDLGRVREAVGDMAVEHFSDAVEMYRAEGIDAVVICVPNVLHYEHTKLALQAGRHVMCEYPLAGSLEQYDELVELAHGRGLTLHHSLTTRHESLHLQLKRALEGLGQPRTAYYRYYGTSSWYVRPQLRGDLFCALHIHFIDQLADLFGRPRDLIAHGIEEAQKVSAVVMMRWPGGLVGTVEFCMGFADKPGYMGTIVTTDGWCGFTGDGGLRVTVHRDGEAVVTCVPPDTSQADDARSFVDELTGTGAPQRTLEDCRETIAMCLECSLQLAAKSTGAGDVR